MRNSLEARTARPLTNLSIFVNVSRIVTGDSIPPF
jgi:hypothetical protein